MSHPVRSSLYRVLFPLQLDPSRKFGSMEEQVYSLARAFQTQAGLFLPIFVGPLDPQATQLYQEHGLSSEVLELNRFSLSTLKKLVALIRKERIEIINWNFFQPFTNPYLWSLTVLTPWVRHDMTDHISRVSVTEPAKRSLKSRLKSVMTRRYRRIFCVSDYVQRLDTDDIHRHKLIRWHHFVNTDRFAPDDATRSRMREQLGDTNHFVMVVVAFLRREKGTHHVIEALATLPEDCVLWVVGGGTEESALKELAILKGVAHRVRFLGHQADVSPYIKAADCLLCPSIWVEAAGLANIEALACGIPIVASNIGGIPEFVIDGETGFLVPPGDTSAIATAVSKLHDDPDLRSQLGRNARDLAIRDHSTHRRLDETVAFYLKEK